MLAAVDATNAKQTARFCTMAMRLGVLGGSFNPIHHGHLQVAAAVQRLFLLDQVEFVVASRPPHKLEEQLVPFHHRYAMVSLALSGLRRFVPSAVELAPPASAFSADTLAKLSRLHRLEPHRLYFIAGADSLLDIGGWRRSREMLRSYNFIFVTRPRAKIGASISGADGRRAFRLLDLRGLNSRLVRRTIEAAAGTGRPQQFLVDVGAPDLSASQVRDRAASGGRIHRLVPVAVREYIMKLNLYGARC